MQERGRILSIDFLRGLVMVIMALDHTRDYVHAASIAGADPLDLATSTPAFFLTRWITHFCAPIFVLLSGLSACLVVDRTSHTGAAARFLLLRGAWLVVAEVTLVTLGWSFRVDYPFTVLQVIWAIGISMMVLSALVALPSRVVGILGLLIVVGHNALDGITIDAAWPAWQQYLWAAIHESYVFHLGPDHVLAVGYPVLPWVGIMMCGYGLGSLFAANVTHHARTSMLQQIGVTAIVVFIAMRLLNHYGDMHRWAVQPSPITTVLSFIDCTKYPPSLLYACMTIGPGLVVLAAAERMPLPFSSVFIRFGRVPFFYYVAHIYLIHAVAWILALAMGFSWEAIMSATTFGNIPVGFGFDLPLVYVVWLVCIAMLYPMCARYDTYKTAHKHVWWLRYL